MYITVDTMGKRVPIVLIDNGSALNVCPLRTATVLGLGPTDFTPSGQTVRSYDNTRREVIGVVTLPLIMGPTEFRVEFQVLDVPSCFNILLGRPWTHPARAVPSSLHQKVKFPYEGAIVTLQGDYDLKLTGVPICEIKPEPVGVPLSGFEYVQCIEKEPEQRELIPLDFCPHGNLHVGNIMKKMAFFPGMGLGRRQQSIPIPVQSRIVTYTFGLGYEPSKKDRTEMLQRSRERIKAKAEGRIPDIRISPYKPTLNGYFVKEGEDFPFCRFPEPSIDEVTKIRIPGFEIFFTEWYRITATMINDEAINDDYWEKKNEDWAEKMDPEAIVTMFQDMVLGLEESDFECSSIHHATMPLLNWYLEEGAITEILEGEELDLPDDSL